MKRIAAPVYKVFGFQNNGQNDRNPIELRKFEAHSLAVDDGF